MNATVVAIRPFFVSSLRSFPDMLRNQLVPINTLVRKAIVTHVFRKAQLKAPWSALPGAYLVVEGGPESEDSWDASILT